MTPFLSCPLCDFMHLPLLIMYGDVLKKSFNSFSDNRHYPATNMVYIHKAEHKL